MNRVTLMAPMLSLARPALRIDDILVQPVRFMKLDCEGSEFMILGWSDNLVMVNEIAAEIHPQSRSFRRRHDWEHSEQAGQARI